MFEYFTRSHSRVRVLVPRQSMTYPRPALLYLRCHVTPPEVKPEETSGFTRDTLVGPVLSRCVACSHIPTSMRDIYRIRRTHVFSGTQPWGPCATRRDEAEPRDRGDVVCYDCSAGPIVPPGPRAVYPNLTQIDPSGGSIWM